MSRLLANLSLDQLSAMAERNWDKAGELDLILTELRHRNTNAASKLRERVETWISDCKRTATKQGQRDATPKSEAKSNEKTPREMQARDWTYQAVAKLRAKLIDLSRKSPLIAFKHTSRSASQLRFVDERPDLLFERLSQGSMGFEPLPGEEQTPADERTPQFGIAYERARLTDPGFLSATEKLGDTENDARAWQDAERSLRARVRAQLGLPKLDYGKGLDMAALARAHGFDPSYDLKPSDDGDVAPHQEDDTVRVLLTRKELDRRLKSIADRATSHLRETGHHTLHLAFGFVQWFEDDASDIASHAPLLVLPVALVKDEGRAKKDYRLSLWEGGLEVNVALIEKAREHWGLNLPALRENETPESYFVRARAVLDQGRRLTLRTFITLSVLPPMVLWRDLDPEKWSKDAFAEHRLLPGLIGATEISGVDGDDSIIDIDDPVHTARVPALITDADASQHRAIMDMAAGRDMAIEGPPGTGKSQTITNMIATALAQGKRVLFVAEKQAALRVVSDRLRVAGFGPLLLELHGDKASRTDVYDGVRERLAAQSRSDQRTLDDKRTELRRHRDLLRRYLSLVRTPLGKLGQTAHALAWREIRLRNLFTSEEAKAMEGRWSPKDPLDLDRPSLTENRELLAQFGKALLAVDLGQGGIRTSWMLAGQLDPFDQTKALEAAAAAGRAASAVADVASHLAGLGLTVPNPGDGVGAVTEQLGAIVPLTCTDEQIVGTALHYREPSLQLIGAQQTWLSQIEAIADDIDKPEAVSVEASEALRDALSIDRCPDTLADAQHGQALNERLAMALATAERDVDRLSSKLAGGTKTTSRNAQEVASLLAELGQTSPAIGGLLSSSLLEVSSDAAITTATGDANFLLAERDEVSAISLAEALAVEPAELDEIAETLDSTGPLARLFSGRYKAARRRAARLLADASDRELAASNLRRIAAYSRARRTFREESRARKLFPAMLWEGIESDFTSLRAAQSLVSDAASRLSALDETNVLRWWLAAETTERQTFSAGCDRLRVMLAEIINAGYSPVAIADLQATVADRISELQQLVDAAKAVGVHPNASLQRVTGGSIAEVVLKVLAARQAFDSYREHPEFVWVGDVSKPLNVLKISLDEIEALCAIAGPVDVRALLSRSDAPAALVSLIAAAATDLSRTVGLWETASDVLWDLAELDTLDLCENLEWAQAGATLKAVSVDRRGAGLVADLLKYRITVASRDLSAFADAATASIVPPDRLDDMYELGATSALLRSFLGSDGQELGRLGSLSLDAARQCFKRVDRELHKLEAAAIVAKRLLDKAPVGVGYGRRADYTELRLLENEIGLTRPRTPLRDVAHRAGQALQALKPVWMMSPTSIAQFIRPESLKFDLLIVDEASQMRPEFSLSCIMRADQFVVVGDANQLPPSDHFQVASTDDGDDASDGVGVDESTESILDLANQRFRTKPRLKWHYRSQHESLIQFSNREFYDRDLVVFPSPMANDDALLGVKCFYTPDFFSDTVYESSMNQREAELIIEQAFGLMQTHPERSIGIVAMNSKQTELIQNEFDRLIVEEERVRKYVEAFAGTIDEFFIKNLENVQGDERDIILISTVYGPDKNGAVRQNFGLMNREVGWRRLNVLVTRAKMSCRLVTSLRPDDIKVTEKSSRGVTAFKSYLTYAHGGAQYDDASGGETDSDFEIFVADALRGGGYEVVYQVGVENFRIDLGVRHESCPVGFIAGIECDGAPYHSGLSVRDRDHIRQTILENLGWNIYRVWSTDWFADPARETAKLLAWLDRVRERIARELSDREPAIEVSKPKSKPAVVSRASQPTAPLSVVEPVLEIPARLEAEAGKVDQAASMLGPREPRGRELRSLGDFQTYEAVRGRLYEIWRGQELLGEVEVVKRATATPRLYGDRVLTAQSEYEGRIEATGDCFRSFDLYAAMREVALRADEKV
jgi:very-short-patch-repair endonuclease